MAEFENGLTGRAAALYSLSGLLFIVLSTLFWAGCSQSPDAGKEPFILALAGPADTPEGRSAYRGVNLYIEKINSTGGVNGRKVVLKRFDDDNSAHTAVEKAMEISEGSGAIAVIGHWYSSCSIAAGKIYKDKGIAALTTGSTNTGLTRDNGWYFRLVANNRLQGSYLAKYVGDVLKQKTASVIYREHDDYSTDLFEAFKTSLKKVNCELKFEGAYTAGEDLKTRFGAIVEALKKEKDAGAIFIAAHKRKAVRLVKMIRDAGLDNPIIGPASFSTETFLTGFEYGKVKHSRPGYYTDNIYVTTHLIHDTANKEAQELMARYMEKYAEAPKEPWIVAFNYDAAKVLMDAVEKSGAQGKAETLAVDRMKVREHLANLRVENAVRGATGQNYFDHVGDSYKIPSIGVLNGGRIISALTQLRPTQVPTGEEGPFLGKMDKTHVVYTGMVLNEVGDFNTDDMTYELDFFLWFRYEGDIAPQNVEFPNAVDLTMTPVVGPKEDSPVRYGLYRVQGSFKARLSPHSYAFDSYDLGFNFHHRELPRNDLIYVTDVLGLALGERPRSKEGSRPLMLTPEWVASPASIDHDVLEMSSMGNPASIAMQKETIAYSRFNARIPVRKYRLSVRRTMPEGPARLLLMLSSTLILLTALTGIRRIDGHFAKPFLLLFQLLLVVVLLLSSETVLLEWAAEKSMNSLKNAVLGYDLLWWIMPAIFLNTAIKRFVWGPLELRSGRAIPNLVRLLFSLTIFLLAFLGIITFVFGQKVTGLLATSGVIAMLFGLFSGHVNLSNILSGIAINLERSLKVGDWVKIGDIEGLVTDITWRSIRLTTPGNEMVSIPNGAASSRTIHNYSDTFCRLSVVLHLDGTHSIERVEKILLDATLSVEGVLEAPPPNVNFRIGKDTKDYEISFYVTDYSNRHRCLDRVWRRVWSELETTKISARSA